MMVQDFKLHFQKLLPDFTSNHIEILKNKYGRGSEKNTPCWRFNKLLAHATSERTSNHDYTDAIFSLAPVIESILNEISSYREK